MNFIDKNASFDLRALVHDGFDFFDSSVEDADACYLTAIADWAHNREVSGVQKSLMAVTDAAIQPTKVASRRVRTVSAAALKPQKKDHKDQYGAGQAIESLPPLLACEEEAGKDR